MEPRRLFIIRLLRSSKNGVPVWREVRSCKNSVDGQQRGRPAGGRTHLPVPATDPPIGIYNHEG
jgi:hypothetical protein